MRQFKLLLVFLLISQAALAQISIVPTGEDDIVVTNYGVSNTYPKADVSLTLVPSSYVEVSYVGRVVLTIKDYDLVDNPASTSLSDLFTKLNALINTGSNSGGGGGGIETETDPTVPSNVKAISSSDISSWGTAATNSHTHPNKAVIDAISASDTAAYRQAFSWGNHALAGYLTSISGSDVNTALGYTAANAASLNATALTSGTVPDARISSTFLKSADAAAAYQTISNLQVDLTPSAVKYPNINAVNTGLALKANLASPAFTGTPSLPTGTTGVTQTAGNNTTALATTAFVTTADNLKANLASPTFTGTPSAPTAAAGTNTGQLATTSFVTTADNLKADLASPSFTGIPSAPTATSGTNTTQIASTAFVTSAVSTLGNTKANIDSQTFTGTPSLPTGTIGVTQTPGNSTTALATTAFVTTADNLKANLASPAFTGTPIAPTATPGTNTTQLATTEFVQSAVSSGGGSYITTNTTQTGLTGDKTTSGVWTFSAAPAAVGLSLTGNITFGSAATYDVGASGARGNNFWATNHISSATAYFGTAATSSGAYIRQGTTSNIVAGVLPTTGNFIIQNASTPPTDLAGDKKLQVRDGSIALPTVSSGIYLTAPNGNIYKLTVSNTGTAVFTLQ